MLPIPANKKFNMYCRLVFLFFVLMVVLSTAATNTTYGLMYHSGNIGTDTTWYAADNPHIVTGDVTVRSTSGIATLTIEAGCTVKFNGMYKLAIGTISGALNAQGTSDNPITFTSNKSSPAPGDWNRIDANGAGTIMNHCLVEYGGGTGVDASRSNIRCSGSSPVIQNCTISNSSKYGISIWNDAAPTIQNCTISNSDSSGIYIDSGTPTITNCTFDSNDGYVMNRPANGTINITGCTAIGNYKDAVFIRSSKVTSNTTWTFPGIPYILNGGWLGDPSIVVYGSSAIVTLTIEPGCTLKCASNGFIRIGGYNSSEQGALNAQGTSDSPITFTSRDATPASGDWYGIFFSSNTYDAGTIMNHCRVEYGGGGPFTYQRGNILCVNSSPTIQNCTISNSNNGIYTEGAGAAPTITCTEIKNNSYGVYAREDSNPVINNCNITGNTARGVYNASSSVTINATNNWWGDASGPGGEGPGTGDKVSSYVDYDPWNTSSTTCSPTAIELVSFTAEADESGVVVLNWETATEVDNAGFNLYRSRIKDGNYKKINGELIIAKGSEVEGASYSHEDVPPANGTYYYKLEDVDNYGVKTQHEPVGVRVKGATDVIKMR